MLSMVAKMGLLELTVSKVKYSKAVLLSASASVSHMREFLWLVALFLWIIYLQRCRASTGFPCALVTFSMNLSKKPKLNLVFIKLIMFCLGRHTILATRTLMFVKSNCCLPGAKNIPHLHGMQESAKRTEREKWHNHFIDSFCHRQSEKYWPSS